MSRADFGIHHDGEWPLIQTLRDLAANGLNVALAEDVKREIAEMVAIFAAAQETEDKRRKA